MSSSSDRNLLFGILALQMDFITREQLLAGMQAWILAKDQPLAEHLAKAGALHSDHRQLLEPLVDAHIRQHGNDPQQSLAAVSSLGSVPDKLAQLDDEQLQASLGHVARSVASAREHDPLATLSLPVGQSSSQGVRFRILRPHAEGGLGRVFVARDEELGREVALKEIKFDHSDDPDSRTRFMLEAEITGGLEHPGIVPVYGLGTYPDGRPFYAMRFIKGDSLKQAIERFHRADQDAARDPGQRTLELRKLLARFIDVCQAIEYAHSRGVLHRDLKPGNVMLGRFGETLVVDWGLAKVKDRSERPADADSEAVLKPASGSEVELTQMGAMVGTLQYMSPEQAQGRLDLVGPATDVFSLGATLYHLLTGRPPIAGDTRDELLHNCRSAEFPRPRALAKSIPAAVEAICLKAMAKEPQDRYASPLALAEDVEHWLADEPASAYREPWRARLGRWGRRHKTLVASAAVLLVTTVAALAVGLVLLGQKQGEVVKQRNEALIARDDAAAERKVAQRAKDQAEAINRFLVDDLLAAARPEELGKDVTVKKALDAAAKKIETAFADQPEQEAAVRLAIGDSYRHLGLYYEAEPHLRRALDLRRTLLGSSATDTLQAVDVWAALLQDSGKLAEAEPLFRRNLEDRRRVLGPEHPDTLWSLSNLAWLLQNRGMSAEAERLNRECLEAKRRVLGPEHRETLVTVHNLAQVLSEQGKVDEAEALTRQNLEIRRRVLGPEDPHVLNSMVDLGILLKSREELDEAETLFRDTLELHHRVFGPEHSETLITINHLASVLRDRTKMTEAETLFRQNLDTRRRVLGLEHPHTLASIGQLAWLMGDIGNLNEAEGLYREALEVSERALGPDNLAAILAAENFAIFLRNQGQLAEAEGLFRQVLERRRRVLGTDHNDTVISMFSLASILSARGQKDEAERLYRERVDIQKRVLGLEQPNTLIAMNNLAGFLMLNGKRDEAEPLYRQILEVRRRVLGAENYATLVTVADLALLMNFQGKLDDAERLFREAVDGFRRSVGPEHRGTVNAMAGLAWLLEDKKQFGEAERLRGQILEILTRSYGAESPHSLHQRSELARMQADQGKLDEAERLTREIVEIQSRVLGQEHSETLGSLHQLAGVLVDQEKLDEAEGLYRKVLQVRRKNLSDGHEDLAPSLTGLGEVLTTGGRAKEAELLLREALEIRQKTRPNDHWQVGSTESLLGSCLSAQGRHEEGEPLVLSGYKKIKASPTAPARRVVQALECVIKLYESWDKPAAAAKWRNESDATSADARK